MTQVFKTNRFYVIAQQYLEEMTEDAQIRTIDMTKEFWLEVRRRLGTGELNNINVNSPVRTGKSTLGISIAMDIYNMQTMVCSLKGKRKFGIDNIARDQQEYSEMMRNEDLWNDVILIDEVNELEQTGENVTIERALSNVFSKVHAVRQVHKIACSPREVADAEADVFLEIVGTDRLKGITHCYLYYRMFKGGEEHMVFLGYVNFDVSGLIKNWKKIEKVFNKRIKSDKEKELIKIYRKKDFYVEYIIRKIEKIELLTKEGILRPRMLNYAGVVLKVEEELRSLARMNILNRGTIKNYIRMWCRKNKIPTSIVGEELMTSEVDGILSLWKSYFKVLKDIVNCDEKKDSGKMSIENYMKLCSSLKDMREKVMNAINSQLEELRRYERVKKEYDTKVSKL